MCFDEKTSWTTLTVSVVSTVVLLYTVSKSTSIYKKEAMALIFLWHFAALMQIPEALAWRNINGKPSLSMYHCSLLAFILNILQPVVTCMVLFQLRNDKTEPMDRPTRLIYVTMIIYLSYWIYTLYRTNVWNIAPLDKCNHLNLHWWTNKPIIAMYIFLISMAAFVCLPKPYFMFVMVLFITSFIISNILYQCGAGSVWCWISALFGIVTYMFFTVHNWM